METKPATLLFVDDERNILRSIQRALRREPYELLFASNGSAGLEVLKKQKVDLVVTDILMPVMDGMAFLKRVQSDYPKTIRLILTGYADREFVQEALAKEYAREVISKPWNEDELKETIRSALEQSATQMAVTPGLQTLINSITNLPGLPQVYLEIRDILAEEEVSVDDLAAAIEKGPSISARLLRWANSSIFGQKTEVETVHRATLVMGLDMVSGLALSQSVMNSLSCDEPELDNFNRGEFWRHANACGACARLLMERLTSERELLANALTAGLLHDLGKLVEDRYLRDSFVAALENAIREESCLIDVEKDTIGATHVEIGHYLAEWWSLPTYLAEVVRCHHRPKAVLQHSEDLTAAVHVANVLVQAFEIGHSGNATLPELETDCWERFGVEEEELDGLKQTIEDGLVS